MYKGKLTHMMAPLCLHDVCLNYLLILFICILLTCCAVLVSSPSASPPLDSSKIDLQNFATRRRAKTESETSSLTTIIEKPKGLLPKTSTPLSCRDEPPVELKTSVSMMSFLEAVEHSKQYLDRTPPKAVLRTTDPAMEDPDVQVTIPSERRRSWTGRDTIT